MPGSRPAGRLARLLAELCPPSGAAEAASASTGWSPPRDVELEAELLSKLVALGPAFAHLGKPVPVGSVGPMRDSSALLERADAGPALRERMDQDGYLLLRGVLGRARVVAAREQLLARRLDEPDSAALMTAESVPLTHDVLRRGPMESIFATLLGGPVGCPLRVSSE